MFAGLYLLFVKVCNHFDARNKAAAAELEKEEARYREAARSRHAVSAKIPSKSWDVDRRRESIRTFHVYHAYLLVYDERGDGWIGFIMPETLESLRAGEYVQRDYHVPVRGRGQQLFGDPIHLEGRHIDVYPIWMTARTDIHEWHIWIHFEDEFNKRFVRYSLIFLGT